MAESDPRADMRAWLQDARRHLGEIDLERGAVLATLAERAEHKPGRVYPYEKAGDALVEAATWIVAVLGSARDAIALAEKVLTLHDGVQAPGGDASPMDKDQGV